MFQTNPDRGRRRMPDVRREKSKSANRPARLRPTVLGAVVGLLVAAVTLAVAELTAALARTEGPVVVVGDAVVELSPSTLIEWSIDTFGSAQRPLLLVSILVVVGLASILLGMGALRRSLVGYGGLVLFAALGAGALLVRPAVDAMALVPILVGLAAGVVGLYVLLRYAPKDWFGEAHPQPRTPHQPEQEEEPEAEEPGESAAHSTADSTDSAHSPETADPASPALQQQAPATSAEPATTTPPRRGFLVAGAGVLGVAAVSAASGRWLSTETGAVAARNRLSLPAPQDPLPPIPDGADLNIADLASFRTPNSDFYRIDTALSVPQVPPQQWTLRIHGLVDRPVELTFDEVLNREITEADITLTCVSNEINGDLVGNTRWLGVSLADLLREAGVASDADQILSTSTDGWTCGTPTEVVMDGGPALLAVGMAGEPLPLRHGFPARMVVPGIYGYVGSTKWVTDIKLTRFADESAYWAERGWAVRAPIKTMCRIDVPGPLAEVPSGETVVAGVAWAQQRGIEAVEVRQNGGQWQSAELAEVPGIDTWRQWVAELQLEPGSHTIQARATDRDGNTQTEERNDPLPDGATGWPSVRITAE